MKGRLRGPHAFRAATIAVLSLALAGVGLTALLARSYETPRAAGSILSDGSFGVRLTAGSEAVHIGMVAGRAAPERTVSVFVDPAYPVIGTAFRNEKGLFDHLAIRLQQGDYRANVRHVDGRGMALAMQQDPTGIVVIGSGSLPDTVLGPAHDFAPVKKYLEGGGELIFVGDGVFYWASHRGQQALTLSDRDSRIDWAGARSVLGFDLVHDPNGDPPHQQVASSPSATASALEVAYPMAKRGARLSVLSQHNGWDAGFDTTRAPGDQRTSLGVLPVGAGRLVLFGSSLFGLETLVADDIARLILSGTDVAPPSGSASATLRARAGQDVQLQLSPTRAGEGVRVLIFQSHGFVYFHRTLVAPAALGAPLSPSPTLTPPPSPGSEPTPSPTESPTPVPSPSSS